MKNSTIIERIAELNDVASKAAAKRIYDTVISTIVEGIKTGNGVYLGRQIGTLGTRDVAARDHRDPSKPGVIINKPAHKAVKFKASKALKREVN